MAVRHPADNAGKAQGTKPTAPTKPRRLWWIIAAAVIVVLLIALVVVQVVASNSAETGAPAPGTSAATSPTPRATPSATPAPSATATPDAGAPPPASNSPAEPAPPAALAPVPLTESVAAVPGVIFSLGTLESVDGIARGPGEVGGPSLQFTVTVRNDTKDTVDLTSTVVNVFFGTDQSPATELTSSGGAPFPEAVAPGATQEAIFVFGVPLDQRDLVRVAVDYSVGVPIVLFDGSAPR